MTRLPLRVWQRVKGAHMADIMIRRANDDDIPALVKLYREFHEYYVLRVPDRLRTLKLYDDDYVLRPLTNLLLDADAALFVADNAGVLVGLSEVYLKRDEPNPAVVAHTYGYLQSLLVTEAMRGQGIGRRLAETAHRWATERGATEMRLTTWEHPQGPQTFYEGIGYRTLRRTLVFTLAAAQ